jgi:5-methylcytosine-specific restriction endonuclease McrBC regulatory subunit McrC
MEKYHPAYISIKGVSYVNDRYSTNVPANQIIKSAILKVLKMESRKNVRRDYQIILKHFTQVDEFRGDLQTLENEAKRFYSANPHYPLTLEFAIKILKDMKMKFTNGNVTWNAFLHNSNDIFEKYVRKVVAKGLDAYVSKWDTPKQIAVLDDGIRKGSKRFIPDILIDYNSMDGSAKAVLDAKNKVFETNKADIGEILHSADMYQLAFYCDKLKTNLGGLIYPAGSDYRPINVMIDGSTDFRFVLFAINMREKISIRHRKLCDAIKSELLFYVR